MALERINFKANAALANELASAGGHTDASLALLIIGLHACGRSVQIHDADAHRALANADLPNDVRSALKNAIGGKVIQQTYDSHTPVIQSYVERMPEPIIEYSYQPSTDSDDDDGFDEAGLGISV